MHPNKFKHWKETTNSIITLAVKDYNALCQLNFKLNQLDSTCVSFYEPDIDNQLTAICVYGEQHIRRILSHLSLALKNKDKEARYA